MIHYRKKGVKEKKTPRKAVENTPVQAGSIVASSLEPLVDWDVFNTRFELGIPKAMGESQGMQDSSDSAMMSSWAADPCADQSSNMVPMGYCSPTSRPSGRDTHIRKLLSKTSGKLFEYQHSEDQIVVKLRILAAKTATFYQIGDGADPFDMLPQFQSRE
jgi:hypothetical protein